LKSIASITSLVANPFRSDQIGAGFIETWTAI
jgi:hypothetical protein